MKRVFLMMLMLCTMIAANAFDNVNMQRERGKSKRVKSTELKIEKQGDDFYVTKAGAQYNGAFWSADGQSMQFTSKDGKINRFIVYYPNRKICYMKTGNDVIYYNRDGNCVAQLSAKDKEYCAQVMKEHGPEGLK